MNTTEPNTTTSVAPSVHAFASPSKLEMLRLCPYMARNCEGWESPTSEAAARGRDMHEAIYNDSTLERLAESDKQVVLKLRAEFVKPCVGMGIHYETMLQLTANDGAVLTFGTIDFLVIAGDTIQIIDWKFGTKPVTHAENNPQLRAYAAMVFQNYPNCKKVFAMIVQPFCGFDYSLMVEFDREKDYDQLFKEAAAIVIDAQTALPEEAVPGADQCKWCNKGNCPAYRRVMGEALKEYSKDLACVVEGCMPALPAPELVEYCDDALQKLEILKSAVADKEAEVKAVIKANGGSANYSLRGGGLRKATDWKSVALELGASEALIASHTVEKESEAYLGRKTRRAK